MTAYIKTPNTINVVIYAILMLAVAAGCASKNVAGSDDDAPKTERGRLKFAKELHSLRIGDNYVFRDVTQYFFVDEKPWTPDDDKDFANKINWCDTSPNPAVEILRCFDDFSQSYKNTYIIRMKDNKPEVQTIDEQLGSVWVNDDGRWLLFRKRLLNVETGEQIPVKGMPWADDPDGSAPVQYVIGISPDMKTVVATYDIVTEKEGKEEFLTLRIINTDSGIVELHRVNFTRYPWLNDHEDPKNDIQPPPKPGRNFVWQKDKTGRDRLVEPELLAAPVKRPTPKPESSK